MIVLGKTLVANTCIGREVTAGIRNIKFPYNGADAGDWLGYVTVAKNYETNPLTDSYANTGLAYDAENHLLIVAVLNDDDTLCHIAKCKRAVGNLEADLGATVVSSVNTYSKGFYRMQGFSFNGIDKYMIVAQEVGTTYWWVQVLDLNFDVTALITNSLMGSLTYDLINNSWISKVDDSGELKYYKENSDILRNATIKGEGVNGNYSEGIAVDPINGDIFFGGDDYVCQFDKHGNFIRRLANSTSNSEGLVVDPSDQTLWYCIDLGYHGGSPDGNRCYHLNPNNTYNKFFTLGRMYTWALCKLTQMTAASGLLNFSVGQTSGTILSPVIKKDDYIIDTASIEVEGNHNYSLTYEYRGSDTAPSTTESGQFHALNIFSANGSNDGWGTTTPGSWQSTVPDNDYIQVRVNVT